MMNFGSLSRSTVVFVMLLAMSVSVSPVAWAQVAPNSDSDRAKLDDPEIEVGDLDLPPARDPKPPIDWTRIFSPTPTPIKDPARMVPPSPTPVPTVQLPTLGEIIKALW